MSRGPAGALLACAAALLVLTACGAALLISPTFAPGDARELQAFGQRRLWQAAFDALSATTCGGLTSRSFAEAYSSAGRGMLALLSLCGAAVCVCTAAYLQGSIVARPNAVLRGAPHPLACLAAFLGLQLLICGVFATLGNAALPPGDAVTRGVLAFCGVGIDWAQPSDTLLTATLAAGWLGAAGWPIWMLCFHAARRNISARRLGLTLALQIGVLTLATAILAGLEAPRGAEPHSRGAPVSADAARLARQTLSTAGAGMGTLDLVDRGVSDGTRAVLALLTLLGGIGGGVSGGLTLLYLLQVPLRGAVCVVGGWFGLAACVAIGLLLIENVSGSRYQARPTFAAALLDASSALAGAGLSAGVTATVTDANLASGMRQSGGPDQVNLYPLGMSWLMLAMLVGRILPLVLLAKLVPAARAAHASATGRAAADTT